MKHVIIFLLVATRLAAQIGPWRYDVEGPHPAMRTMLEQMGLTAEQIRNVDQIYARKMQALAATRADLELKRAQIARALVPSNPDLNEVQRLMREALELELAIRMGMIEAELEVRRLVGEEVWIRMVQGRRTLRGAGPGPGRGPAMGPRYDRPGRN